MPKKKKFIKSCERLDGWRPPKGKKRCSSKHPKRKKYVYWDSYSPKFDKLIQQITECNLS